MLQLNSLLICIFVISKPTNIVSYFSIVKIILYLFYYNNIFSRLKFFYFSSSRIVTFLVEVTICGYSCFFFFVVSSRLLSALFCLNFMFWYLLSWFQLFWKRLGAPAQFSPFFVSFWWLKIVCPNFFLLSYFKLQIISGVQKWFVLLFIGRKFGCRFNSI